MAHCTRVPTEKILTVTGSSDPSIITLTLPVLSDRVGYKVLYRYTGSMFTLNNSAFFFRAASFVQIKRFYSC